MDTKTDNGRKMRIARAIVGYTQDGFARYLGLTANRAIICQWEKGHVPVPEKRMKQVEQIIKDFVKEFNF